MRLMILRGIALPMFIACLFSSGLQASGWGRSQKFNGLGASIDYAYSKELHDGGVYASFRGGRVYFLSYFIQGDVGYRFRNKSLHIRAGAEVLLFFVGLEAGVIGAFRMREHEQYFYQHEKYIEASPGLYCGLAGALPAPDAGFFLSTGGNFFFINHEIEFYFMITGLFNLSR